MTDETTQDTDAQDEPAAEPGNDEGVESGQTADEPEATEPEDGAA